MPLTNKRRNLGKHIIVSDETHAALKRMCYEAGVLMTTICDMALRAFVVDMGKMTETKRNELLQKIAGGAAFAQAFAPFAELIKVCEVVDEKGEGESSVTPSEGQGTGQGPAE